MIGRRSVLLTANLALAATVGWVLYSPVPPIPHAADPEQPFMDQSQESIARRSVTRIPATKPLFKAKDLPPPTVQAVIPAPAKAPFRLIGVATDNGQGVAVVQSTNDGSILRIRPDETLMGWQLVRLARTEIELSHASGRAVLKLHGPAAP